MSDEEATCDLGKVKDKAQEKFPKLYFQPVFIDNALNSLMVSKYHLVNQDCLVGYLPSLWVVIETKATKDNVTINTKLINFQGIIVGTEKFDSEDKLSQSKFLQSLNDDHFGHCQGIPWIKEESNKTETIPCLVERVGKSIIKRSFGCQIVVAKRYNTEKCKSCNELYSKLYCRDSVTVTEAVIKKETVLQKERYDEEKINDDDTFMDDDSKDPLSVDPFLENLEEKVPPEKYRLNFSRVCKICLVHFDSELKFDDDQDWHEKAMGKLDHGIKCPVCRLSLKARWFLTDHFAESHPEKGTCCCACLEIIPPWDSWSKNMLRKHITEQHNLSATMVVCPTCGSSFAKKYIDTHVALKHSEEKPFVCDQCGKAYGTERILSKHINKFHPPKEKHLHCSQCQKTFLRRPILLNHLRIHSGKKPYKCPTCDYRHSQPHCVCGHYKKIHGKVIGAKDVITLPEEKEQMDSLVGKYLNSSNEK